MEPTRGSSRRKGSPNGASARPVHAATGHDAVLDSLRTFHEEAVRRDVALVLLAAEWARLNPGQELDPNDALGDRALSDEELMWLELSRHGCTHIDDLSIPIFATCAGTTEFQARRLIRESLLLVFLLPLVWKQAADGHLEVWRARKLADECWGLHPAALAYIDRNMSLATARHTEKGREAIIAEARIRFMHEVVQERQELARENLGVAFDFESDAHAGVAHLYATMDLTDARDLQAALEARAEELARTTEQTQQDSPAPIHVRHAWALGDLARASHASAPPQTGKSSVNVFLHLTPEALVGGEFSENHPIRVEGKGLPQGIVLTPGVVREWFNRPGTGCGHKITIRPVIDLSDHIHVDAYEVPDRIKEQAALRDGGCVFPWCTRKAWFTDCDHIIAWKADGTGGPTCSCNLAPLCRRHHRAKTHADNHKGSAYTWWRYESLGDSKYLWHGPRGTVLLRTNTGVHEVSSTYRPPTRTIAAAARTVSKITETIPTGSKFHARYPAPEGETPYRHIPARREFSWRELHGWGRRDPQKIIKVHSPMEHALYFYGQWWDFCHGKT